MDPTVPTWPLFVLAAIQLGDAAREWSHWRRRRVLPRRERPAAVLVGFTPIKLVVAAVGLVIGAWIPEPGLAACLCLVVYIVLAIGAHVRARDFGRNLFVNAVGMLALSAGATYLRVLRVVALDP